MHPGPLMQANRKVEVLRLSPERFVVHMVKRTTVIRIGTDKAAPHAEFLAGITHLSDRQLDRLQRQHRRAKEAIWIRLAVIRKPAVIGTTQCRCQRRITRCPAEQTQRRIQNHGINAIQIHVRDTRVGIEAALPTLNVPDIRRGCSLPSANGPGKAEPLRSTQHFTFDT